jgi:hypothetical protein
MSNRSPIISAQFPPDLAAWLEAKAKAGATSVSSVLRGLAIQARSAEAAVRLPIMDEEDAARVRPARILTTTEAKRRARA